MSYLSYYEHGGDCCGITHIYDFDSVALSCTEKALKDTIGEVLKRVNLPHMIEVVLNEKQLEQSPRKEALRTLGFKKVTVFKNGNSGNKCYVFHLVCKERP